MDWKDALSSIRGDLDEPKEGNEIKEEEVKKTQKTPLTVVIDKKGRNGKTATIIEGFEIPFEEVEEIARLLKQKLGVGGSVRDGEILIQGDHRDKVKSLLQSMDFKIK